MEDVALDLGRGRGGQGDEGALTNLVDDGADAAILGAEVMAPFGDTMRLIDGEEGNLDGAQKVDVFLLGQGFGGHIEQLALAFDDVLLDLVDGRFGERRVDEVGHIVFLRKVAHGIDLILHEGNERRNNNGCAFHEQRRKLVAK